ncbi:MAG: ATP phosphoribosyltransferase regulatory subunit [Planctomycetota bacterium]
MAKGKFKAPKGTRDLYPDDLLRQRYITEAWRRVSIRHGFDEIAGPTFEHLDLYKEKSGEGIVSELFSFRREGGDDDYALRPEFTPTLARLYAAKAASLPSPTKWFTAGPYFRAERPQRGRLREFLQWNCDVIGGDDDAQTTADVADVLVEGAWELGLDSDDVQLMTNDRRTMDRIFADLGVADGSLQAAYAVLDKRAKVSPEAYAEMSAAAGFDSSSLDQAISQFRSNYASAAEQSAFTPLRNTVDAMCARNLDEHVEVTGDVARGLAYYTGTVFELIADGERAVAGGGRYDNLIELFGGPPTPAVGFGMGDVVLSLLLEDKGLMPEGQDLREALSQPGASLRPEAFVLADEDQSEHIEPLLANLRRGIQADGWDESRPWAADRYSTRPLHARRSYRAKRKKQMQDASSQFARFAVTINEPDKVELRDMDAGASGGGDDLTPNSIEAFSKEARSSFADFSVQPESPVYVGKAIASLLG